MKVQTIRFYFSILFVFCGFLTKSIAQEVQVSTALKDGHTIVVIKEPGKKDRWHYARGCQMLKVSIETKYKCEKCYAAYQQEEAQKEAEEKEKRMAEKTRQEQEREKAAHNFTNVNSSESNEESYDRKLANPYLERVQNYNAKQRVDNQALNAAAGQTFEGWAAAMKQGENADYITPANATVQEFARQGNAAAAYGTAGAAVTAQIISSIGQGRAKRKAEEAAFNYEFENGCETFQQSNYNDALRWFYTTYKLNKHKSSAANYLGIMYLKGLGVNADPLEAIKWFNIVIDDGNEVAPAYYYMARMYYEGLGVNQDFNKAFILMQKSAHSYGYIKGNLKGKRVPGFFIGNSEATYHLAFYYLTGSGVTQNYKKAYDLFLSLVNQDYGTLNSDVDNAVNFAIGVMYYYGLGLEKNVLEAKKYISAAAVAGNADAYKMLNKINGLLNFNQVSGQKTNRLTQVTFAKFLNL